MAERVGFEPTVPFRVQRFSRPSRSTTPAPLLRTACKELPFRLELWRVVASLPPRGGRDRGRRAMDRTTLSARWLGSATHPRRSPRHSPRAWTMAERVGFEPTVGFPLHTLSKRAP